ncbi:hypothetical protein GCM10027280_22500 [Micromonospora polyrhachis]|uniref:Uncharacterized protein n=1 Tax=Micromonospora polyrhachis TaxID=1282883 RepID=A0A7W7SX91_9ACTN|nr:hypothetical protein [Micromonospora polyrhachis]MBB4962616.1 hypothetical protein [Micromonospora polyrhachis]
MALGQALHRVAAELQADEIVTESQADPAIPAVSSADLWAALARLHTDWCIGWTLEAPADDLRAAEPRRAIDRLVRQVGSSTTPGSPLPAPGRCGSPTGRRYVAELRFVAVSVPEIDTVERS